MAATGPQSAHGRPLPRQGPSPPVSRLHRRSSTLENPLLTKLHNIFPAASHNAANTQEKAHLTPPQNRAAAAHRPFVKIGIISWNMNDRLPKGDLTELFGSVPPYEVSTSGISTGFPLLQDSGDHPYHLVVVAGQECPSLSGLPRGIGAGFKPLYKEQENGKDKESRSRHKDKEESMKSRRSVEEPVPESIHGWTAMLEDHFCHGGGSSISNIASPISASAPDLFTQEKPGKTRPHRHGRKGPYQLLVKDRLMGIYLAIFIHRDAKHLVRSTSKSAVTAGLIGGRVGNKGGVGISIDLNGTSILFLNAHLAAHEGKVHHRLANYAKIKAELAVEDYLEPEDSRVMSEDVTDKFDFTFLFGDLNFRLDITRLHCDWLISRQEYKQALAFDQLSNIMKNGKAFHGFSEAPIDFAPTFKYDVLRTLKRSKSGKTLSVRTSRMDEADECMEDADNAEVASVHSSMWTSIHSKSNGNDEQDDSSTSDSEERSSPRTPNRAIAMSVAAQKAKARFLDLINSAPSSPRSPIRRAFHRNSGGGSGEHSSLRNEPNQESSSKLSREAPPESVLSVDDKSLLRPPPLSLVSHRSSQVSDLDVEQDNNRGVYDTSHKQRVPSWCDRILMKSTVVPDPEPDEDEQPSDQIRPNRNRVGLFLSAAFRPFGRARRDSLSSTDAPPTPPIKSAHEFHQPGSPTFGRELSEHVTPFSRFLIKSAPANEDQTFAKSAEVLPVPSEYANFGLAPTGDSKSSLRRSFSVTSSSSPKPSDRASRRASASAAGENGLLAVPSSVQTPSRWKFLPSFFTHTSTASTSQDIPPVTNSPLPRKGDIICLGYNTLDDRAMRRLEARSDHRPVRGAFAVYI